MTQYNKLVRDKIPEKIRQNNKNPVTHIAEDLEYWEKLKQKLSEETNEFLQDSCIEELTDILEVLDAIIEFKKINKQELYDLKEQKANKRGRFKDRIILDEVED